MKLTAMQWMAMKVTAVKWTAMRLIAYSSRQCGNVASDADDKLVIAQSSLPTLLVRLVGHWPNTVRQVRGFLGMAG